MKLRNTLSFLLLFLTVHLLPAQVRIQGRIQDAETGEAIAYAQVRSASGWGTISNVEGRFILNLPEDAMLTVSHIGYEELRVLSSELKDSVFLILIPRQLELDEVVIMPVEAEDLLRDALAAIPENHGHDPVMGQAFYREFLQAGDSGVSLNEAVLELYHVANQHSKSILKIVSQNKWEPMMKPSGSLIIISRSVRLYTKRLRVGRSEWEDQTGFGNLFGLV